ncbi:serine hydrolase [Altererythrobacter sp. ZODW24]|uniref:serine hydrolase n=1 Tax=Altererythrobacter sp. ZODW24 TaxID=2185142 RepID=UPI000DF7C7E8|nr:serine hydrolase [Altererythrobacter sp. ZODW24]
MLRYLAIPAMFLVAPAIAQDTSAETAEAIDASALEKAASDVVAVLMNDMPATEVFTASFLEQVPADRLVGLTTQLESQFGPITGVESVTAETPSAGTMLIRFEKALATANIALSPGGKVAGLLIKGVEPIDDSLAKIVADVEALPGNVGIYYAPLATGTEPVLAIDENASLAIGSAFKLYVLSAIAHKVEAGELSWDQVIPVEGKSFTGGTVFEFPDGAPMTIQTVATLMISISDNSATDMLVRLAGQDALEAELRLSGHSAPAANIPFPTTAQFVKLKADPGLVELYAGADDESQQLILDKLDEREPMPDLAAVFGDGPNAIDKIEWFASGRDIAGIFRRITELTDTTALDIMAVSPSVQDSTLEKWDYIGFKGGSEPGVLNVSWLMRDEAGEWHTLIMSWNNTEAEVTQSKLELLSSRIFALPRE